MLPFRQLLPLGKGECAAKRGGRGRGGRGGNGKGWKKKREQQPEVLHWDTMQLATARVGDNPPFITLCVNYAEI